MKKLHRFRIKKTGTSEAPNRITNETVAEHRQKILAGGRRFKYPIQYAKHRLVINTIIISTVALAIVSFAVWWQLYPVQNTSTFFYRVTRVLPLPVASIDGQAVRYSNYLEEFKSQEHYLAVKEGVDLYSKSNKAQLDWIKRQALDNAIADSYAAKIAKQNHVAVTKEDIDDAIIRQRQSSNGTTSEETYYAIVLDHFNWTPQEVREVTARELLRQKVAYSVDGVASKLRDNMIQVLKTESDFDKVVASVSSISGVKLESNSTPMVPDNNQDGGLADEASKLKVGQISPVFKSTTGDGYYVVKLLQRDANRVSYASIKVPLTIFQNELSKIKAEHKVTEYISIPGI